MRPREDNIKPFVTVLFIAVILLRAPLGESFWLDESVTFYIISNSAGDAFTRAVNFQGQSPFYFLVLWGWAKIFGQAEVSLRSLSLVLMGASAFILYRLSRLLKISPLNTLFVFFALEEVIIASIGARPYALALFASIISVYWFWQFIFTQRAILGVGAIIALALVFYSHYLFLALAIVHVAVTFVNRGQLNKRVLVLLVLLLLLLISPGLYHFWTLVSRREEISFSHPIPWNYAFQLFPRQVTIYVIFSLILARIFFKYRVINQSPLGILLLWAFLPPLVFFLASKLLDVNLFLDRYFLFRAPGLALLISLIYGGISSPKARSVAVAAFAGFAFFVELSRVWKIENWRSAAIYLNQDRTKTTVFLYSGLVESGHKRFYEEKNHTTYLLSPLIAYPVNQKIIPLPPNLSEGFGQEFYDKFFTPELNSENSFYLASLYALPVHDEGGSFRQDNYFKRIAESAGFSLADRKTFGLVSVSRFVKNR